MVNGGFKFFAGSRDLAFERRDPALKLFDRPGIEILATEGHQGIVRPPREEFVHVHGSSVDRSESAVNNGGTRLAASQQ